MSDIASYVNLFTNEIFHQFILMYIVQ